jgi:hypothetical protein
MKKAAPPVRERILESAHESFYREGIRAIGVDTVIARSGVAKMSLASSPRTLVCAHLDASPCSTGNGGNRVMSAVLSFPYVDFPQAFAAAA